ncbi:MAG: BglG family transcription antiterminator [Anaerobacillus sp.]|uniref:BglG family transcription antiterminator n=1 Tax=Anaerobacillus sp. TaxID=1872506 RepID=UPI00391B467D
MYVSARERQILETLLSKLNGITVKELADSIDVSVRTIHRDLKGVEDILKGYNLKLIKKSGKGIQVAGNPSDLDDVRLLLFNLSHNEYTPEERQTMIFCALLEATEPIKLIALANDLNVTIATVSADLNKLEERLSSFGLSLIRKRGYGVEVFGSETAKRRAMSKIISQNVNEFELLSLVRENIQKKTTQQVNSASERLLGLVEKKKLLIVEKVIEEINKELSYAIADSAYMGLVVHLALALERIIQGENIQIDQNYLESLKETLEYKAAEKIIMKLQKLFEINIPDAEIGYITMHLRGAKLRHDKEYLLEETSLNVAIKAKNLIEYIEKQFDKDLSSNQSLFQGLVAHLRPAIYRIKQNMGISNPLLEKIKVDYQELFSVVKEGTTKVFSDLVIPEEEVGYLVLHFGSALIESKGKDKINALILCSSGIGTSKMLATRIQQEIPNLTSLKNVSLFDLKQHNLNEFDLVISTLHSDELPKDYILVSPILTEEEIEKIKSRIKGRGKAVLSLRRRDLPSTITLNDLEKTLDKMIDNRAYADIIITVLKGFEIVKSKEEQSIQEVIGNACDKLYKQGIINHVSSVIEALFAREKLGGLGIPNTTIALFHTRSDHILKPSFKIISLESSLLLKGMDQSFIDVDNIILLLAPQEVPKHVLEVLSYISTLIIEDEKSVEVFQSKDQNLISAQLATKLEHFYYEKLNGNWSV